MKNKVILFVLIILSAVVAGVLTNIFMSEDRLVYVDVNKLIEGYNKTKIAKNEFEKKAKMMQSNVDTLVASWQQELKNYERSAANLSAAQVKSQQNIIAAKQNHVTNYSESVQKQIAEEDKKITQALINDINQFVQEYGKSNGYRLIFGATGGGNIMYADQSADLTDDVLKELNSRTE